MKKVIISSIALLAITIGSSCNPNKAKANTTLDNSGTVTATSNDAINWETSVNNSYWDKNNDQYAYISVKVVGNERKTEAKRVPLNISLVLDRSGSMGDQPMEYAKDAAKFVVNQLSTDDILSIVNYDDVIEVTSPSQPVKNKEILIQKINEITSRSMTNLSGGMLEGYKQVASTKKNNYVNRVLLLTDGLANAGIVDPERLNKIAISKFLEEGIALSTFGLGAEYNEDLLTQMSESGRGNYYYIDAADKIPQIFAKELDGLLNVVAQNASVSIILPKGVVCDRVYGYSHSEKDGKVIVAFNDIYSKEEKVFLLKVRISDKNIKALNFSVELTYTDAETFSSETMSSSLKMQSSTDKELINKHKNTKVNELIALFEATDAFDLILSDIDKSNYDDAKLKAKNAIERLQTVQKELPSEDLKVQEKQMQDYLDNIDEMRDMDRVEKLELQKINKSVNYSTKKMKK